MSPSLIYINGSSEQSSLLIPTLRCRSCWAGWLFCQTVKLKFHQKTSQRTNFSYGVADRQTLVTNLQPVSLSQCHHHHIHLYHKKKLSSSLHHPPPPLHQRIIQLNRIETERWETLPMIWWWMTLQTQTRHCSPYLILPFLVNSVRCYSTGMVECWHISTIITYYYHPTVMSSSALFTLPHSLLGGISHY